MGDRRGAAAREFKGLLGGYRTAAGLSLRELAARMGWSTPTVHRMEVGTRGTTTEVEIVHYLAHCGAPYARVQEVLTLWREAAADRGFWLRPHEQWMGDSLRSLIFHESTSDRSVNYEPEVIPGLLQTEPYMRALFAREDLDPAETERCVRARLRRQLAARQRRAVRYTFLVHERALRFTVGDRLVMNEQMLALLFAGDQGNLSIRVVPLRARHDGVFGPGFVMWGFPTFKPMVYLDTHFTGVFFEEPGLITRCRGLVPRIGEAALSEADSRALIARLADQHDRVGRWEREPGISGDPVAGRG